MSVEKPPSSRALGVCFWACAVGRVLLGVCTPAEPGSRPWRRAVPAAPSPLRTHPPPARYRPRRALASLVHNEELLQGLLWLALAVVRAVPRSDVSPASPQRCGCERRREHVAAFDDRRLVAQAESASCTAAHAASLNVSRSPSAAFSMYRLSRVACCGAR
eukprot:2732020-Prymnesium_polylepis.1